MGTIGDAINAAEDRKRAAGLHDTGVQRASGESADRAIYSGFDIDYDELLEIVNGVGTFFTRHSEPLLNPLFRAAWADGFLTGLMYARDVAPHHEPPDSGDPPVTGSGGASGGTN